MMVRLGHADGSVAGAVATTADTVRAALQVIGLDRRYRLVSSYFLMMLCEPHHDDIRGALIFADCGLVVDPNAEELAQIAIASADSAQNLLDIEPRVALLSFSTSGSARHPLVEKVVTATGLARAERPDLLIEGDVQLDASLVPEISARKATGSVVHGRANVLISPISKRATSATRWRNGSARPKQSGRSCKVSPDRRTTSPEAATLTTSSA